MVELRIFNISGQEVEVLIASHLNPGSYTVTWDASKMASGVYISIKISSKFYIKENVTVEIEFTPNSHSCSYLVSVKNSYI